MSNSVSNRQMICEKLIDLAKSDSDIVVLTSDSRGSAGFTPFVEKYPEYHVETGIAEQNIVGIAAGLAQCGKKPVVASPACFLSMRSIEQVKVDVAYSKSNVLLLGISGGVSYGALGMSHHSLQDIATLSSIPGIEVVLPADRFESAKMIEDIMARPRPVYMRIGRNPVPDVYEEGVCEYIPSKATVIKKGKDATIIATGEMVYHAKCAAQMLEKQGIDVAVINMHTVKPIDEEAVMCATDTGCILTMEEHSIYGGLGSTVSRIVSEHKPVPMKVLAFPDEPVITGTSNEVFEHYGFTAEHVCTCIKELISKK